MAVSKESMSGSFQGTTINKAANSELQDQLQLSGATRRSLTLTPLIYVKSLSRRTVGGKAYALNPFPTRWQGIDCPSRRVGNWWHKLWKFAIPSCEEVHGMIKHLTDVLKTCGWSDHSEWIICPFLLKESAMTLSLPEMCCTSSVMLKSWHHQTHLYFLLLIQASLDHQQFSLLH